MTQRDIGSGKPKSNMDDFLNDYLSDLLGSGSSCVQENHASGSGEAIVVKDGVVKAGVVNTSAIEIRAVENKAIEKAAAQIDGAGTAIEDNALVPSMVDGFRNECKGDSYRGQSLDAKSGNDDDEIDDQIFVDEPHLLPQERYGAIEKIRIANAVFSQSIKNPLSFNQPKSIQELMPPIKDGFKVIPTFEFGKELKEGCYRTQPEALVLLLNSLYFLRRPLPEKVRKTFLAYGEQAIDDFNLANWLKENIKTLKAEVE